VTALFATPGGVGVGKTFVAESIEGIPITFLVLTEDGANSTVQVGTGATSGGQAVLTSTVGDLTIPQSVQNGTGNSLTYTVTKIGGRAFNGCNQLTSVIIPNSVTSIGDATATGINVFYGCSKLESVTVGDSVEFIGNAAFQSCSSLTSITLPNSVTAIGTNMFQGCTKLESATISHSLAAIPGNMFFGCSALSSVTIPDSVTSFGNNVFRNCAALAELTFESSTAPTFGTDVFTAVAPEGTANYPEGSEESYTDGRFATAGLPAGWTLQAVSTSAEPATLTLGEGAEDALKALVMYEGSAEIELTYTGRDTVASEEIAITRFKNTSTDPESPSYEQTGTIEVSYDLAEKTLTVEPAAFGSYKLTITVSAKDGFEEATIDIFVEVAQKATEFMPDISLDEPLQLKAGDAIEDVLKITFTYTGEKLLLSNPQSSNSGVAEIMSSAVNEDGKGGEIVVKGKTASEDPVTLSIDAASTLDGTEIDTNYVPYTLTFEVTVSRSDAALSVAPTALELKVGESDTATISNNLGRTVSVSVESGKEGVAEATYADGTLTVKALQEGTATITISAAESSALNAAQCTLKVTVTKAADPGEEGVYAFVCQEQGVEGYTLVVKNRSGEPSGYGALVHSYATNLATIKTASRTSGWPWSDAADEYKLSVSKIVFVEDAGNFVPLSYMSFMFAGFSSCKVLDFTWLETANYSSYTLSNFASYASAVYNTDNINVTVIFGNKVKFTDLSVGGLAATGGSPATIYREYNGTYSLHRSAFIPEGAATFYTAKPDGCPLSNDLADYEVKLGATEYIFTGSILPPAADVSAVMKNNDAIVLPPVDFRGHALYGLVYQKYNTDKWESTSPNAAISIGHYQVQVSNLNISIANRSGYLQSSTAYVEYDVIPGGEISLYSDEALQTPVSSDGLQLTGTTEFYAKCTTGLSGLSGTNEMNVGAESSDPAILGVTSTKLGEYGDGYWTYKITLTPYTEGEANVSVWGHTGGINEFGNDFRRTGTLTTVLPVDVDIEPATLTLGEGAQDALDGIVVYDEPVTVDLAYSGRDDATADEVTIEYFKNTSGGSTPNYQPTDTIEAGYDPVVEKLTVTNAPGASAFPVNGSYKLTITVPGAGAYGAATIDIYFRVSLKPLEFIPTQPLEQPLQLTPGELRTIQYSYSSENLSVSQLQSSNSAVAEIIDYTIDPDAKTCEILVRAKAASTSSVNLTFLATAGDQNYTGRNVGITVKVSKSDEPLSVDPSTLALAIGKSGSVTVLNDRNRTVTAVSSNEDVAKVSYAPATKQLSIEAIGEGTATITLTAAENSTLNASDCAVEVTVTETATASLSTDPEVLTIKIGESGNAEVSYEGDGAITVTSSDAGIATATLEDDTLTVNAVAVGTTTITLSAPATENYGAAECTVEVIVSAAAGGKEDAPPLDVDTEYEVVVGEEPWMVSYSEVLQYEVSPAGIISVTSSNAGKTLTVSAVGAGTAVLTIWAEETATTAALEPVEIEFTVADTTPEPKPVVELDPLSLPVGATATSEITLYDADDNPISGIITFSGYDEDVIEVSFDADTSEFTIHAVGEGVTTLTISSEDAAEDYTMQITVTEADDDPDPDDPGVTPVVKANGTGVKVSGTLKGTNIPEGAEAVVTITAVTTGDAFDKHIAAKGDGDILVVYEISLTVNGEEVHDNFGTLTIELPVGDGYEADTVLVRHLHESGEFTEHELSIVNGIARLEVTDLSSFGLEAQEVTKPASGTGTKPAGSGTTTPAKTGDEAPLAMVGLLALGAAAAVTMRVTRRRKSDALDDERD
jgi:hypothetical protein